MFSNKPITFVSEFVIKIISTVFPHIVAALTILFWIHKSLKISLTFPLCNENLNSFLTIWGNYSRRGNYSREETIWENTVFIFHRELYTRCGFRFHCGSSNLGSIDNRYSKLKLQYRYLLVSLKETISNSIRVFCSFDTYAKNFPAR